MLFVRVEVGMTIVLKKTPKKTPFWPEFLEQKPYRRNSSFPPEFQFSFCGRGRANFWREVYLQNWLASIHSGAYTSMPYPFFGARDVCIRSIIEIKVTK